MYHGSGDGATERRAPSSRGGGKDPPTAEGDGGGSRGTQSNGRVSTVRSVPPPGPVRPAYYYVGGVTRLTPIFLIVLQKPLILSLGFLQHKFATREIANSRRRPGLARAAMPGQFAFLPSLRRG